MVSRRMAAHLWNIGILSFLLLAGVAAVSESQYTFTIYVEEG